jgi:hypothetical protein
MVARKNIPSLAVALVCNKSGRCWGLRSLARSRTNISTIIHQISTLAILNLAIFLPLRQFPDFRLHRPGFDSYFGINTDRSLEVIHRIFELSLSIEKVGKVVV